MLDLILGTVLAILVAALVIWIVGRLGLGMTVDGFMPAIIAAVVIGIVSAIIVWLLGLIGLSVGGPGFWAGIVSLIVAAVVLMVSDRFVSGMKVNGFVGAIVAAIAIGVFNWLIGWVLSLF